MPSDTKATRTKGKSARSRMMDFGENMLGAVGGMLVTFAVCYLVAMAMLWIANRMISIGGLHGAIPTAVIALVLTVIFYLYDRNNP